MVVVTVVDIVAELNDPNLTRVWNAFTHLLYRQTSRAPTEVPELGIFTKTPSFTPYPDHLLQHQLRYHQKTTETTPTELFSLTRLSCECSLEKEEVY